MGIAQNPIQCSHINVTDVSELNTDSTTIGGIIHNPSVMSLGPHRFVARATFQIQVRRERLALSIGDFKVRLAHDSYSMGKAVTTTSVFVPRCGSTTTSQAMPA